MSILDKLPVDFGTDRGRECVFFGCMIGGKSRGWKARPLDEKTFWCKLGTPSRFWNLDQVLGSEVVYITEGELDACALVEAGISEKQVLSVPTGASQKKREEGDEVRGYAYALEALEEGLRSAKRFVLCTDADPVGLSLRSDLAAIFGAARCWFVDWPDGCKDANDMLRSDGPDALCDLVLRGALPWPVEGLYNIDQFPDPPPMVLWDAGFAEWEGRTKLAASHLSVVTGHGSSGKTLFMSQLWFQIAKAYDLRLCVLSQETPAKWAFYNNLIQFHAGKVRGLMTDRERAAAHAFVLERYLFMQRANQQHGLKWVLDTAEVAVVRHGCRAVIIDPWNRLERTRPHGMSETDYIGQVLSELATFAKTMGCHVQIIAHPSKTDPRMKGAAPSLEDIAGSKAWETMPDQGFVMHRPKRFEKGDGKVAQRITDCEFSVRKSRFEELGPEWVYNMRLDLATGRYVSTDFETRFDAGMRGEK